MYLVLGVISVDVETDSEFEVLFPERDRGSEWEDRQKKEAAAARRLGTRWAAEDPNAVIPRICFLVCEREAAGQTGMTWTQFVWFIREKRDEHSYSENDEWPVSSASGPTKRAFGWCRAAAQTKRPNRSESSLFPHRKA